MPFPVKEVHKSEVAESVAYAIIESGLRWSNNMLSELQHNFGRRMPTECRDGVRQAITGLQDALAALQHHVAEVEKARDSRA